MIGLVFATPFRAGVTFPDLRLHCVHFVPGVIFGFAAALRSFMCFAIECKRTKGTPAAHRRSIPHPLYYPARDDKGRDNLFWMRWAWSLWGVEGAWSNSPPSPQREKNSLGERDGQRCGSSRSLITKAPACKWTGNHCSSYLMPLLQSG